MRKLLILTASPKKLTPLRLAEEVRDIKEGLALSGNRNSFSITDLWAVRPRDFYRAMLREEPQMVHFAGHGEGEPGLYLEDREGNPKLVTGDALSRLFKLFSPQSQIECVVLNGCYSSMQAEVISKHVPYVVGMQEEIGDRAAIEFAVGFYDAIWHGRSVEIAFESGKVLTALDGTGSTGAPLLVLRKSTPIPEVNLGEIQKFEEIVPPFHETTSIPDVSNENAVLPVSDKGLQRNILLLSANQKEEEASHREKEVLVIENSVVRASLAMLEGTQGLPRFSLPVDRSGLKIDQISKAMSATQPFIIDIAGDKESLSDFFFSDIRSTSVKDVEVWIGEFFQTTSSYTQCVILNGCYTEKKAKEIIKHIEFLIGISQQASQTTTTIFLREFYYQIGVGVPIRQAYDAACNQISRSDLDKFSLPILLNKEDEKQRKIIEEELVLLEKKIEEKPESIHLITSKGELLEKTGEYEQAALAYERALRIEEKDYRVWWRRGKTLSKLGQYAEAQKPYENALSLQPPFHEEYVISQEYGLILRLLDNPEKSIALYKKSLWLEPKYRAANYEKRKAYKSLYSKNTKKVESKLP